VNDAVLIQERLDMRQPPNPQIINKVKKLSEIAEALRQGSRFHVTRLTIFKSFCAQPEAAAAFALFLALRIQKKMRNKKYPQQFRELVDRAVSELNSYLADPNEERKGRLSSLYGMPRTGVSCWLKHAEDRRFMLGSNMPRCRGQAFHARLKRSRPR
jgi:predicted RecB family nuclease